MFDEINTIGLRFVGMDAASQAGLSDKEDFFRYVNNVADNPALIANTPAEILWAFLHAEGILEP